MKRSALIVLLLAIAAAVGVGWWVVKRGGSQDELVLFGNVDLRQVDLAFNNSQRIDKVLAQEGERVRRGQLLAQLDKSRLEPQVEQADAMLAAQREVVERLHNGSRPEEIAQARANVTSAEADAANAGRQYGRLKEVFDQSTGGAVSKQDVDNAKALMTVAKARVEVNRKALELALAGPRKEEIAEAEARLRGSAAQLAYLRQELADADLIAPVDATVRTRVLEPGDMASPQRPVLILAVTDPKWIRAYVTEPDLGKVQPGMTAGIGVDSFPDRRFEGWVGFISPVAEFTPKAVQTEQLRTSLVYEVRVFVKDPKDELRLGMPATVYLALHDDGADPPEAKAGKQGGDSDATSQPREAEAGNAATAQPAPIAEDRP